MVRIRLRRTGRKNAPVYRIVVAESTSPRDGRFIEVIGQYAPREAGADGATTGRLNVLTDRANHWLNVGAQPSDTVRSLLRRVGVYRERHEARIAKKKQASAVPLREAASGQ
jgi:small subunit ribosomal protein S16